jgi:hypothetical protein
LARVMATLRRRSSARKPTSLCRMGENVERRSSQLDRRLGGRDDEKRTGPSRCFEPDSAQPPGRSESGGKRQSKARELLFPRGDRRSKRVGTYLSFLTLQTIDRSDHQLGVLALEQADEQADLSLISSEYGDVLWLDPDRDLQGTRHHGRSWGISLQKVLAHKGVNQRRRKEKRKASLPTSFST